MEKNWTKEKNKTYEQDFRLKLEKRDFMCDFALDVVVFVKH